MPSTLPLPPAPPGEFKPCAASLPVSALHPPLPFPSPLGLVKELSEPAPDFRPQNPSGAFRVLTLLLQSLGLIHRPSSFSRICILHRDSCRGTSPPIPHPHPPTHSSPPWELLSNVEFQRQDRKLGGRGGRLLGQGRPFRALRSQARRPPRSP